MFGPLRPIILWFCLVAVLCGVHTHQTLMERTRLLFSLRLNGLPPPFEPKVTLDGVPVTAGQRLSLGLHSFSIEHRKIVPFSTNIFVWYGQKDLGNISLGRASATLTLQVDPMARVLSITGSEFTTVLTNSAGMTLSVPTDDYVISARFAHVLQRDNISVALGSPNTLTIAPRFGTLALDCNQAGASFALRSADGRLLETGGFPSRISELPEGSYGLTTEHHHNKEERRLSIKAATTNILRVELVYGAANIQTEPPGARIISSDNIDYGETPAVLTDLLPGSWSFRIEKTGYETTEISLAVAANATNNVSTNLLSHSYATSVAMARQYLANNDYERALQAATDALKSKPGDAEAERISAKAQPFVDFKGAQTLAEQGNYASAITELEKVMRVWPTDERVSGLIGEYRVRQKEEADRAQKQRRELVQRVFSGVLSRNPDSALFERYSIKTEKKASEVWPAVLSAIRDQDPGFTIGSNRTPEPDLNEIVAKQEFDGGSRICVIVVGQTADTETEIWYEVLEYKLIPVAMRVVGVFLGGSPPKDPHVPIHPSRFGPLTDKMKGQIEGGLKVVRERISKGIEAAPNKL